MGPQLCTPRPSNSTPPGWIVSPAACSSCRPGDPRGAPARHGSLRRKTGRHGQIFSLTCLTRQACPKDRSNLSGHWQPCQACFGGMRSCVAVLSHVPAQSTATNDLMYDLEGAQMEKPMCVCAQAKRHESSPCCLRDSVPHKRLVCRFTLNADAKNSWPVHVHVSYPFYTGIARLDTSLHR